jgi:hypothetical protein
MKKNSYTCQSTFGHPPCNSLCCQWLCVVHQNLFIFIKDEFCFANASCIVFKILQKSFFAQN